MTLSHTEIEEIFCEFYEPRDDDPLDERDLERDESTALGRHLAMLEDYANGRGRQR